MKDTENTKLNWESEFDEQFKCIQCTGDGHAPIQVSETEWEDAQCEFHGKFIDPLKSFIHSLLSRQAEQLKEGVNGLRKPFIKSGTVLDDNGVWNSALSQVEDLIDKIK